MSLNKWQYQHRQQMLSAGMSCGQTAEHPPPPNHAFFCCFEPFFGSERVTNGQSVDPGQYHEEEEEEEEEARWSYRGRMSPSLDPDPDPDKAFLNFLSCENEHTFLTKGKEKRRIF